MKEILKNILKPILGRSSLQSFYKLLHLLSLKGMNFGGSEVSDSGEKYILEYMRSNTSGKIVLFDVGANQGQYANLAYKVFDNNAVIYSFEPGEGAFEMLTQNTEGIMNIKRYNVALGAADGNSTLHYDKQGSGLASLYHRELSHAGLSLDKEEKVETRSIDSFCTEHNIASIDFLKMDIEGHELEALRGAKDMLSSRKIKAIQFEFGGTNIDSRTFFKDFYDLLKDNFVIYRVLQNGLSEITMYSELDEIFTTVNYFAKLK